MENPNNNQNNNQIDYSKIQEMINAAITNSVKQQSTSVAQQVHDTIVSEREQNRSDKEKIEKEKEASIFLATIYNDIDRDLTFLPSDFKEIVDKCVQAGSTDIYRQNLIKKELIDRFFEEKTNVEKLSDAGRKELNKFFSLTNEAKLNHSNEYYHLIADIVNVKKNLYLVEERKKQAMSIDRSKNKVSKEVERAQKSRDYLLKKTSSFNN